MHNSRLTVAQYQSASAEALQAEVQKVQDAVCSCQAAYSKALSDVNRSLAKIQQLQEQTKSLREEDAVLSAKVPLPVNRLCRVRQWLSQKVAALDSEQAALEGKQMALLQAESRLRAQETGASLLDEAANTLNTAAAAAEADAARTAAAKHDREVAAARRQLRQMAANQQQEQLHALERQQAVEARSRVAEQCQAEAVGRLGASQAAIKAGAAAVAEAAADQHARHLQSLLTLKTKVDEVREAVAKKAEKTRQLRKQKKEHEQREFEALQEQGHNPYEVYRVRDAEAAAAHAAAQLACRQEQRKADIAAALAAEDRARKKLLAKQEYDRKVEENYQRQMGITAQQQRTDAYMRGHTLTKQAILNPTSRVSVYPSEAVLVKPVAFGLGRSSPEALRKVTAKHGKGAVDIRDCPLLPRQYRSDCSSSPAGSGLDGSMLKQARVSSDVTKVDEADTAGAPRSSSSEAQEPASDGADSEEARDVDSPCSSSSSPGPLSPAAGAGAGGGTGSGRHTMRQHNQDESKHKQLRVMQLSKFEAERLAAAKQRHKAQIAQPKAAFGRVFSGYAFIADPPEVVFKDCVPGQTYKTTVQLINRSFTGSSIRLLEVPTEVMHVLELAMPPSGCLAPGAAATLKVTFRPQADEALSAAIPLLADTGPLSLPFKALLRQGLPSIDPSPHVCLDGKTGGIMLGASGHAAVTISNAGVLTMLYSVKVLGPLAATTDYDEPAGSAAPADADEAELAALQVKTWAAASLAVAGFRIQGIKGRVGGYGSCSFKVSFTPQVSGLVEVPVLVSFTAPDSKGLNIPPIQLTLQATGKKLPVSTLTPIVDFKCVMFGQSYAAPLRLANAGNSAMKVLIAARPELSEWINFTPDFGFIQASDTLTVSVALKPTPDMLHKLAKYLLPQLQDSFEIPIQVNAPGQPLPLPVKLRLQATASDLHLRPKTLDFGRVPLTEAAGVHLTITNPSALPQSFSFGSKLPLGLRLSPNAGYGRVLPGETVKLLATFQPPIPGLQFFDLCCRTLTGRLFKLEGKCDGLQPDVTLSHNVVKFPATACEDSNTASLVIRNTSNDCSHMFEFGVPQGSHLQVTPRVGVLQPQGSLRVQLDFAPPATPAAAATAPASSSAPAGDAAAISCDTSSAVQPGVSGCQAPQGEPSPSPQQQQQQQPASTSGQYREWLLPCFIKQAPSAVDANASSPQTSGSSTAAGSTASDSSNAADCVLHVSVSTCAVSPELHLVSPQLQRPVGKNYWLLDFGALPVGERTTREVVLQNTGADVAALVAAPLDPLVGAFTLVNALRPLAPQGGQGRVLLAFCPSHCCEYQEMLALRSSKSRLRLCLKGQGIAPTLAISPASVTTSAGGLAFGDVLLSDPVCKELKLQVTNTCSFTVSYSTRFIGAAPVHPQAPSSSGIGRTGAAAAAATQAPSAAAAAAMAKSAGAAAAPASSKPLALSQPATTTQQQQQQQQQQEPGPAAAAAATADNPGPPSGCFWCKPSGGVLDAGQTQELTVVFAPLGGSGMGRGLTCGPLSPYVSDRLQVLVPHQQQDVVMPLHGTAWPDGVFVSGVEYKSSSSSSSYGTDSQMQASRKAFVQDPYAAILVAAATAAAAVTSTSSTTSTSGNSSQAGKGKQAAAAAASAQQQQQAKAPSQVHPSGINPKDLASALAAAGYCDLTQAFVTLPGPVSPGQLSTTTVEFGAIKSSAGGAAAGELIVEDLPAEAKEAGWSVDPVKLAAPAGERRPLTIRYTAPSAEQLQGTPLAALGQLQLTVKQVVKLSVIMKGGCQPMMPGALASAVTAVAADGTRRLSLVCTCMLAPQKQQQQAQVGAQAVPLNGAHGGVSAVVPGGGAAVVAKK